MSVSVLSIDELAKIRCYLQQHRQAVFDDQNDINELHRNEVPANLMDDHLDGILNDWFDRCYIANQLAWWYQYGDFDYIAGNTGLQRIDIYQPVPYATARECLNGLTHLRYNIHTNNGHSFLGRNDHNRLDIVIATLAIQISQFSQP